MSYSYSSKHLVSFFKNHLCFFFCIKTHNLPAFQIPGKTIIPRVDCVFCTFIRLILMLLLRDDAAVAAVKEDL